MNASDHALFPKWFHIGVPRSATTTIQLTLRADPRVNCFRSRYFNTPLWYSGVRDFACDPRRVNILSAETLVRKHGERFKFTTTMEHIRRRVPDARIILTIREQRAWLLSRYKWGVSQAGLKLTFDQWLQSDEGGDFLGIGCYATLVRYLLSLFPQDRIHVLLFENMRDDYAGFFRALYGILGLEPPALKPMVTNASAPDRAVLLQRWANQVFFHFAGGPLARLEARAREEMIRIATRLGWGTGARIGWEHSDLCRGIEDEFRLSNRQLQTLCGLDLQRHGYLV